MIFAKPHYNAVKDSVMISGIFRSGTTILGKILGSMKNVEYSYEPPIVFTLDYLIQEGKISEEAAIDILRTYFAEDVMFNFHHGRGYNFREKDASYIYNMKDKTEIIKRWNNVNNVRESINLMNKLGSRLVFKVPSVYSIIPPLLNKFEKLKIIELQRDLKSILSSMMVKGWFNDNKLNQEDYAANWPYLDIDAPHVPYYAKDGKNWNKDNEETRAVKIINNLVKKRFNMQHKLKKYHQYKVVKYEDIITNPKKAIIEVSKFIEMEPTQKTEELIETILPTKRIHDVSKILQKCNKNEVKKFLEYNKKMGY